MQKDCSTKFCVFLMIFHEVMKLKSFEFGLSGAVLKMFKYGIFSGPYLPVFGTNTGKYGPKKSPCLDTFHAEWRHSRESK